MDKPDKNGLIIAGYKYHPQSGAMLVIAHVPGQLRVNDARYKKPQYITDGYIVAWLPQGQRYVDRYSSFDSYHYAYVHFMRLKDGNPPPETPYTRDMMQKKVYEWQWRSIRDYNRRISMRRANDVIARICGEFGIRAPLLNFRKDRYDNYCFFESERHEIGGHRRLLTLGNIVHECAHLVDIHNDRNIFQAHGPSFVRNLIRLSVRYIDGNSEAKLTRSARDAGLLGLPPEIHYVAPPPNPLFLPAQQPANTNRPRSLRAASRARKPVSRRKRGQRRISTKD